MPPKRPASPSPFHRSTTSAGTSWFKSEPIHDRDSVFTGYFWPECPDPKQLQRLEEVQTASHRMLAWRRPSPQTTLFGSSRRICSTGHDDDDEKGGGGRLKKVLEALDLEGALMCARVYGGKMLGPVRFEHIENAARGAVDAWRAGHGVQRTAKKIRTEEESLLPQELAASTPGRALAPDELNRQKRDLIKTLQERDQSITALRGLLDDKKSMLGPMSPPSTNPSPSRVVQYDAIPFSRLSGLENARDATISFLLSEIDKAEMEGIRRKEGARLKEKAESRSNPQTPSKSKPGAALQPTQPLATIIKESSVHETPSSSHIRERGDGISSSTLGPAATSTRPSHDQQEAETGPQTPNYEFDLDEAWEEMEIALKRVEADPEKYLTPTKKKIG